MKDDQEEEELEGEEELEDEEEEEEEAVPEFVADFDPSDDDISEVEEGAWRAPYELGASITHE